MTDGTSIQNRRRKRRRRMDIGPISRYLQHFDYRRSPYARPNQKWLCGRTAEGAPCHLGPDRNGRCIATFECRPIRKDHHWQCTRSEPAGGKCESGPLPDGTCCRPVPRCRPVRNWRARRGVTARWTVAVLVGLVLALGGSESAPRFLSPGGVTFQHSRIENCSGCHSVFDKPPTTWLHAAFSDSAMVDDSKRCLACHQLGEDGLRPHSLPPARLDALTAHAAKASAPSQPFALRLAAVAFDPPREGGGALPCMTCHREHQGNNFDLAAMDNQRCMACHAAKFASLSHGHPDFTAFPYRRRTRLVFNHVSHIGKHFREPDFADLAPKECKTCHMPEVNGGAMRVESYQVTCAGCHAGQIEGTDRLGAKGVAVITIPGLDMAALRARGAAIGGWPEDADGAMTPFMDFLLAGDPGYGEARDALAGVDVLDLTDATEAQIAAVETMAWAVKGLLFDLATEGDPRFRARLQRVTGQEIAGSAFAELVGSLPVDAVRGAQRDWFPNLLRDVPRRRSGEAVPIPAAALAADEEGAVAAAPEAADGEGEDILDEDISDEDILEESDEDILEESDEDILEESDEDILEESEDDILGEEDEASEEADEDILADEPEESEAGDETAAPAGEAPVEAPPADLASGEDWSAAGGWYREDFTLRYRPTGHGDRFLRAWLELAGRSAAMPGAAAARKIFTRLSAAKAPGACAKCHSIDARADGEAVVNWHGKRSVPNRRGFTAFSHTAHFALLDEKGCMTCHVLDSEADYAAGFKDSDPTTFASNFVAMKRGTCATCHTAAEAGDGCLTCHNYHIGTFPPAVASTPKMMTGLEK